MGMKVEIALFEGFDELDAVGPYEVLANVDRSGGSCDVQMVAHARADVIAASHGLRVEPDGELGGSNPDLVVVPGGGWNDRDDPGAWTEAEDGRLPKHLASLHDEGVTLASVCTGGMLLAEAGLLDGVPAVTHHTALDDLAATGGDVRDARVVDAGDLLSAGGVTSGLDLAFHLVDREFGRRVAERIAQRMEYEPSDDVLVV